MEWISGILAQNVTLYILISSLAISAIVFTLVFRAIVLQSKDPLKAATQKLEGISQAQFPAKYQELVIEISNIFKDSKPLFQQWTRFQKQIYIRSDGTVCSYRQPEEFFNSATLLKSRWLPLCKSVPGYLVAMGLVFTFLGLAVVIFKASHALGSSRDLDSLRELLGAASLKFWTSLAGVFFSVISSGYIRHLTARYNVTAAEFSNTLSSRIFFLSQEYSLHLSSGIQAQQLAILQEFKTEFAETSQQTKAEIVKELQAFSENMKSVTQDTFSVLVEKSTSELSNAISNSLQGVAETFITINDELKQIVGQVQPLPENFKLISQEVAKLTSDVSEHIKVTSLHVNDDFSKTRVVSSQIAGDFLHSLESTNQIKTTLVSIPETLKTVSESLEKLGKLHDIADRMHEAAEAVKKSSDTLLINWKQQADHISTVDQKLGSTVSTLPTIFTQYSTSLQKFTDDFDNHLAHVLGSLSSQIESLESSQSSLRGIAEALQTAANAQPSRSSTEVSQ